jgi:putative peptidoglycan lipid II flippase
MIAFWGLKGVGKGLTYLVSLSVLGYLFSFGTQVLISYYFGVSAQVDGYWIAFSIFNLMTFPLIPIREALVPQIHLRMTNGLDAAASYLSQIMLVVFIVASLGCIFTYLSGATLISLISDKDSSLVQDYAEISLLWLAPAILFFGVSETLNAVLTSLNRVNIQSISRVVGAASIFSVIGIFSGLVGSSILAIAFLISQILTFFIQLFILNNAGFKFSFFWPINLGKQFYYFAFSILIGNAAMQLYLLYEKKIFSGFEVGLISSFQYAVSITNTAIAIFGVALANLFWPKFLNHVKNDSKQAFIEDLSYAMRIGVLFFGFFCSIIYINSDFIVKIFLERGAFDSAAVVSTAACLRAAIYSAIPIAIINLGVRSLLSLNKGKMILLINFSIAAIGIGVLTTSQIFENSEIATLNWLFANVAGMSVTFIFLIKALSIDIKTIIKGLFWSSKYVVLLFFSIFSFQYLTKALAIQELGSAVDRIFAIVGFSFMYVLISFFFGLLKPAPKE